MWWHSERFAPRVQRLMTEGSDHSHWWSGMTQIILMPGLLLPLQWLQHCTILNVNKVLVGNILFKASSSVAEANVTQAHLHLLIVWWIHKALLSLVAIYNKAYFIIMAQFIHYKFCTEMSMQVIKKECYKEVGGVWFTLETSPLCPSRVTRHSCVVALNTRAVPETRK